MYPKKFVVAADIKKTVVWTIDRVEIAEMPNGDTKPVVFFKGQEKGIVSNVTNCTVAALEYGDDTDKWAGKTLEVYGLHGMLLLGHALQGDHEGYVSLAGLAGALLAAQEKISAYMMKNMELDTGQR